MQLQDCGVAGTAFRAGAKRAGSRSSRSCVRQRADLRRLRGRNRDGCSAACSRPGKAGEPAGYLVYLAGEGETLWDICKKYDVPMDGMREMNNPTQDEIHPGDQLLIVKGYAVDKEMQIV